MVEGTIAHAVYEGDGVTRQFPIVFEFEETGEIHAGIYDEGTQKLTELDGDFCVDGVKKTVLYPGYAPGQEPPASEQPETLPRGKRIAIWRLTDRTQETDLGERYPLPYIEAMIDRTVRMIQEQQGELDRAVKVALGSDETPEEFTERFFQRAQDAEDAAGRAEASEQAAARSAESAGISAEQAAASQRAAATSARSAASSAASAAESAHHAEELEGQTEAHAELAVESRQAAESAADAAAGSAETADRRAADAEQSAKSAGMSAALAGEKAEASEAAAGSAHLSAESAEMSAALAEEKAEVSEASAASAHLSEENAAKSAALAGGSAEAAGLSAAAAAVSEQGAAASASEAAASSQAIREELGELEEGIDAVGEKIDRVQDAVDEGGRGIWLLQEKADRNQAAVQDAEAELSSRMDGHASTLEEAIESAREAGRRAKEALAGDLAERADALASHMGALARDSTHAINRNVATVSLQTENIRLAVVNAAQRITDALDETLEELGWQMKEIRKRVSRKASAADEFLKALPFIFCCREFDPAEVWPEDEIVDIEEDDVAEIFGPLIEAEIDIDEGEIDAIFGDDWDTDGSIDEIVNGNLPPGWEPEEGEAGAPEAGEIADHTEDIPPEWEPEADEVTSKDIHAAVIGLHD